MLFSHSRRSRRVFGWKRTKFHLKIRVYTSITMYCTISTSVSCSLHMLCQCLLLIACILSCMLFSVGWNVFKWNMLRFGCVSFCGKWFSCENSLHWTPWLSFTTIFQLFKTEENGLPAFNQDRLHVWTVLLFDHWCPFSHEPFSCVSIANRSDVYMLPHCRVVRWQWASTLCALQRRMASFSIRRCCRYENKYVPCT